MEVFNLNSIWLTVLILSVLVVVHEFGHFITARAFGVTVHEFSVGFGPLIGKFVRNGIQYSFRWVLLGGFVKIAGMDIALEGEKTEPEIPKEKTFLGLPLWKKIVVIGAGPIFNLVLAVVLFYFLQTSIGMPNSEPIIRDIMPNSPAYSAGIKPGDRFLKINGQNINNWNDITGIIQKSEHNKPLTIRINRNGQIIDKQLSAQFNEKEKRYYIGIINPFLVKVAPKTALTNTLKLPGDIIRALSSMIKGKTKGSLMGPIGMVNQVEQSLKYPPIIVIWFLLFFSVNISISLFLFNSLPLPLPLLDGGWIVIMILEKVFRREFSTEQKALAQMIGLVAIIILGLLIAYGDIIQIIKDHKFFGG